METLAVLPLVTIATNIGLPTIGCCATNTVGYHARNSTAVHVTVVVSCFFVRFEADMAIRDETLLPQCIDNNEPLAFGHMKIIPGWIHHSMHMGWCAIN
jgi:hypothetical protein